MAITLEISSSYIGSADSTKQPDKMKFLILSLALVAVVVAQQPQKPIAVLRHVQDSSPTGSYSFSYETENGISHSESGVEDESGKVVQGQFAYTAPGNVPIELRYVADANGFHPEGEHLPTPPPIPEMIARALEYIRSLPEQPEQQ